jgi:hypothetical protein
MENSTIAQLGALSVTTTVHCHLVRELWSYWRPLTEVLGNPPQQEHQTSHGNMKNTKWKMEGNQTVVNGRRYANEDPGVAMLCSISCSELGRHAHLAPCRVSGAQCLGGEDSEHIIKEISDKSDVGFDWISHRLFWERSGIVLHFEHCVPTYGS